MKQKQLERLTEKTINETREALQLVYDSLNNGQQKQIVKVEAVAELFDRYGVKY